MSEHSTANLGDDIAQLHIRLLFRHATIDPLTITRTIGLEPSRQWRVGEQRSAPNGVLLPGVQIDTVWSLSKRFSAISTLDDCLQEFITPLEQNAEFIKHLAFDSTSAEIILSFPGQSYFGGVIGSAMLASIAKLGLELGIEVFPDSAT